LGCTRERYHLPPASLMSASGPAELENPPLSPDLVRRVIGEYEHVMRGSNSQNIPMQKPGSISAFYSAVGKTARLEEPKSET